MSFVDANGIMGLTEELVFSTISSTLPHLDITAPPFQKMSYREAMEKVCCGTKEPYTYVSCDLRSQMSLIQRQPLFRGHIVLKCPWRSH